MPVSGSNPRLKRQARCRTVCSTAGGVCHVSFNLAVVLTTLLALQLLVRVSEASPAQVLKDMYYELARQAREQLVSVDLTFSERSAQFETLVRQGLMHNGYNAAEIKVALQGSCTCTTLSAL